MSRRRKLLDIILSGRSDTGVSFEQLRQGLLALGFREHDPRGSHCTFSHLGCREILTIPKRKPAYVRKARAFIIANRLVPDGSP